MYYNIKCLVFYLKFWCFGISGIDVFNFLWMGLNMWFVFLLVFILKIIKKCLLEKVVGILVVFRWILVFFWFLL